MPQRRFVRVRLGRETAESRRRLGGEAEFLDQDYVLEVRSAAAADRATAAVAAALKAAGFVKHGPMTTTTQEWRA